VNPSAAFSARRSSTGSFRTGRNWNSSSDETDQWFCPDFAAAHNDLATALFIEHRYDEAARHFRAAIRLAPDNPQFYSNLDDTLRKQGQFAEAARNYQTALQFNPNDVKTKAKLQALTTPGSH
jgi:tetratricopeptide (TPR) repeat protein